MRAAMTRAVSLFLTAVFLISSALTGTFAWQSISQTAKNENQGGAGAYPVQILKLEKDVDGNPTQTPVPGAAFYLFTKDGVQIGGRYVTDSEGKIHIELPSGDYYFEEIRPGYGFTFDADEKGERITRYPFTVTEGEPDTVVVTAYNRHLSGPLTVQKIVENADGSPLAEEQKQQEFVFTVTFSDEGTYSYRIDGGELQTVTSGGKIYLKHGQTAVFENLPVGVTYTVTEQPVLGYTITSTSHHGNISEQGAAAVFVNTYDPDQIETGSLTVSKEVLGDGADLNKEFTFTITLNGKTETFTLKHGESKTFPGLPIGTAYTVTETDYTADGYVASVRTYTGVITGKENLLLPFVNVYDPDPSQPGSLEITKEVIGEHPDPDKEFTFSVTFSDGKTYPYRIDGGELQELTPEGTFTLKAGQKAAFENLPHGVTYTVKETGPAGYLPAVESAEGTIIGGQTVHVLFQNHVPDQPEEPGKLIVTKKLEGEYPEADKAKEFHFTLIVDGKETEFTLKPGESMQFELPPGAQYEVREDDYYPNGYIQSVVNGFGTITAGQTVEAVVTNTYVGEVMTELPGEKTWELGTYGEEVLPKSIIVRLKHGDRVVEEITVTPDENGEWHYTFHVPKYDTEGKEIQYTVEEIPVESFIPSYDGLNVKNTYLPPVTLVSPVIHKVVEGQNVPEAVFSFLLRGENGAPMPEGSTGNSKVVAITGSGKVEIGEISFTKPGVYTYTISELNSGGTGWTYDTSVYTLTVTVTQENGALHAEYTLTKDGEEAAGLIFTNRYEEGQVVPPDEIQIAGQKIWNHGDNPEENRPDSIIVYVYADGELILQKLVTEADGWQYVFSLPKYAADGHEIVYTIGEADVPDYDKAVSGYDLVNTYHPKTPTEPSEPAHPDNPGNPGNPNYPDGPQTGDTFSPWPWIALMIGSLFGLVTTTLAGRKSRYNPRHGR